MWTSEGISEPMSLENVSRTELGAVYHFHVEQEGSFVPVLAILSRSFFGLKARNGRELRALDQCMIFCDGAVGITYEGPVAIVRARTN
jgi:hypothetical protein